MWHARASLADTHFAWWQTTHPRTSYHKLEGLSPGWVRERQRCMCVWHVLFFFLQWLGKTPKRGIQAPFQMNAYVSGTMREVAIGASKRNSSLTLCATKSLHVQTLVTVLLFCSRDPLGGATPRILVYAGSEREGGKPTTLKNN